MWSGDIAAVVGLSLSLEGWVRAVGTEGKGQEVLNVNLGQQTCREERTQGITKGQKQMDITKAEDWCRRWESHQGPNSDFLIFNTPRS